MRTPCTALLLALPLVAGSCGSGGGGGGSGGGVGTLVVEATDAALAHSMVAEAIVYVTTVRVHPQSSASSGFTTIYDGPPLEIDLVQLRNGLTRTLVQADLPAGTYRQLRLVFSDAYLRLTNGNEYRTSDGTLHINSQSTAGEKVFVEPAIQVSGGVSSRLLVDFDLTRTFRPMPANDPPNAASFSLHPVLRGVNRSMTGEIRGVVTEDDGSGSSVGTDMATVYILPPGEVDPANSVTSTATMADGSYAVIGLVPGSYDVLAEKDAASARVDGAQVFAGSVTAVDLFLP